MQHRVVHEHVLGVVGDRAAVELGECLLHGCGFAQICREAVGLVEQVQGGTRGGGSHGVELRLEEWEEEVHSAGCSVRILWGLKS